METTLTVRQLKDLGIFNKAIDYLKAISFNIDETKLKDEDSLTFDSEFKVKKMNIYEVEEICNENGINLEEFCENVNMSACPSHCHNISRAYMFAIDKKCKTNPKLKEALDFYYPLIEEVEECPHCGKEL